MIPTAETDRWPGAAAFARAGATDCCSSSRPASQYLKPAASSELHGLRGRARAILGSSIVRLGNDPHVNRDGGRRSSWLAAGRRAGVRIHPRRLQQPIRRGLQRGVVQDRRSAIGGLGLRLRKLEAVSGRAVMLADWTYLNCPVRSMRDHRGHAEGPPSRLADLGGAAADVRQAARDAVQRPRAAHRRRARARRLCGHRGRGHRGPQPRGVVR